MFARRRSCFLLPCFNIVFLSCCLFSSGNASTMSLVHQKRQFQQQNDKKLEISEFVLPEAESEILQNDMELVPALDGNSDIYLLVQGSAATDEEQNYQFLIESSNKKKSDNIESSSDMLMQESVNAPAMQILEIPEDGLNTNIHNEMFERNVLDQEADLSSESFQPVSESMIDTITEAGKEIQDENKTELDRNETNHTVEQFLKNEITRTEKEENTNETPAFSLETEGLPEPAEAPQASQSEGFEIQPAKDLITLNSHENTSQIGAEKLEETKNVESETNQINTVDENESQKSRLRKKDDTKEQFANGNLEDEIDVHAYNEHNSESKKKFQSVDENYSEENRTEGTEPQLFEEDKHAEQNFSYLSKEDDVKTGKIERVTDEMALLGQHIETPAEVTSTEYFKPNDYSQAKADSSQDKVQPSFSESLTTKKYAHSLAEQELFTETDTDKIQTNEQIDTPNPPIELITISENPTAEETAEDYENQHKNVDESGTIEEVRLEAESDHEGNPIQNAQHSEESQNKVENSQVTQGIKKVQEVQENAHYQAENFEKIHNDKETKITQAFPVEIIPSLESHESADDYNHTPETQTEHINDESITEDERKSVQEETVENQTSEDIYNFAKEDLKQSEKPQAENENLKTNKIVSNETPVNGKESLFEETHNVQNNTFSVLSSEETQQTDSETMENLADEIIPEKSCKPEKEKSSAHLGALPGENMKDSQNQADQITVDDKNSDNILNTDTCKSETEKKTMATTNNELIGQHHTNKTEKEHEQEPQIVLLETVSSTTLKPLNVMDSVLSYINTSFVNEMTNDSNNKQENQKEEQVVSSKLRRYDGAQVWRIVVQNDREKKLAEELHTKYDGQLWKEVKQEVDYLLKPQVLADAEQHVRAANLSRFVLIDNLQKVIEVENPSAEEIKELQNRKGSRLTWQAYHRLDDIHSYFDVMAKTYTDICSVEVIGYSIEKRPLKILKISNGNVNNPSIWIDGGMHAREWISPAVVTFIANQIIEGWDDLPAYMRNINWYIHAVANPDGYEYSHVTDRLWRKNMRSHGRSCPGVDLNRNFGFKWGGKGTSANPCSQTYRGSKAFSEPETFYISKFISNFPRETFKAYFSFHSYGQYILYPWGYDYHITKDMADMDLVARQAGTIITKNTGSKFTVGSSATTLYPAAGGSDDWAKGIAGIKYSYTIEMGDTGRYGFVLPADHIEANGKNGFTVVETVARVITMGKNARRRKFETL